MKEITPEEIELARVFEDEIKGKKLEEAITVLERTRQSTLIRTFCDSVPDLVNLDFRPFAERLRRKRFEIEPLDIEFIYNIALSKLDYAAGERNDSKDLVFGKKNCSTKHLGFPVIIFFEYLAQDFGADREQLTSLFEEYDAIIIGCSPYQSREERLTYIQPVEKDQPIEDKIKGLTMRSDSALKTGRFHYKGKPVLSQVEAEAIELREMTGWLRGLKEASGSRAQELIAIFHQKMKEGMDFKEEVMKYLKKWDVCMGDYLQPVSQLWLCGADIEKYAPKVGLRVKKLFLPDY